VLDIPVVPEDLLPTRPFYFLRHGETQFNLERKFQGSIDIPLNDTGVAQARAAARVLADHDLTRIVASPANRVLKTASFTSEVTGVPMHIDADLMEFNVGSFEGQCIVTTKKAYGLDEADSFMSILPDDAEKWHEFVPRVCASVRRWTDKYDDENLLIAAHGLVFRALTLSLLGEHLVSQNAEPYHFDPSDGGWQVRRLP